MSDTDDSDSDNDIASDSHPETQEFVYNVVEQIDQNETLQEEQTIYTSKLKSTLVPKIKNIINKNKELNQQLQKSVQNYASDLDNTIGDKEQEIQQINSQIDECNKTLTKCKQQHVAMKLTNTELNKSVDKLNIFKKKLNNSFNKLTEQNNILNTSIIDKHDELEKKKEFQILLKQHETKEKDLQLNYSKNNLK